MGKDKGWNPKFYHRWRAEDQGKIRVGYLSPYFKKDRMMQFLYAFLHDCDRERFQTVVYMCDEGDGVTFQLMNMADGWRDISHFTVEKAARRIYEDEVDILVCLSGEGNCKEILGLGPAPIQIAGMMVEDTSGVDCFLGDGFLGDGNSEEKMLVLPGSHICYVPIHGNASLGEVPFRQREHIVFGCFHDFREMGDGAMNVLARIMEAVPGSHMMLGTKHSCSKHEQKEFLQRIADMGMDAGRIEFSGAEKDGGMDFRDVDIVLDSFPCSDGYAICDALYMGVPVVTLKGESCRGRLGWSVLQNLGLGELCAATMEEYVQRAVMLAGDSELLTVLRQNLRGMMGKSALMDGKGYMRDVEDGYQMLWRKFLSQQKPPSSQAMKNLVLLMNRFIEEGDTKQTLAVADMLLEGKMQSLDTVKQLCVLYLDAEELGRALRAIGLLPENCLLGKFLRAKVCFLQAKWKEAEELCKEVKTGGGLDYPWGGAECQLLAEIYSHLGNVLESAKEYKLASENRNSGSVRERMAQYSKYLFKLQYVSGSREFMYREECRFREFLKDVRPFSHKRRRQHSKLRIGYISPDFRENVLAYFSQAFFAAADRSRFEVYGYAKCVENDVSRMMEKSADVWRYVLGREPEEIARLIYEDEVDILVELNGHTGDNSLEIMAFRPAPVQICGIGYFSTTGLPAVDYFLVDKHTATEGEDAFFVEKLLRLPHSHFCYTPMKEAPDIDSWMPFEKNGHITFGSMNNMNKTGDDVLEAWGKILAEIPDASLFLKNALFEAPQRKELEMERMRKAGIDVSRVIMEGFTLDYLKEYRRMDIALDTFPYPGGGTTCDALYMGVPVITLAGSSNHERFGLSILANIGLEELCGRTVEEYVARAVGLARDKARLRKIHGSLRDRLAGSAVMNQKMYMKDLEAAYEAVWKRYEEDFAFGKI